MAKIGIDARFYGSIGKGLGRYTQKLIENLAKIDDQNTYYIFLRKANFNEFTLKKENFIKVEADFEWYSFEEQFKFPKVLNKYDLDLVHFPHFNVPLFYFRKFVVTIHDLILLHFPTIRNTTLNPFLYRFKFLAYKIIIKSAILRSSRVITVSKFTKRDILENFRIIPQEKILVTYEACEDYCMLSPDKDDEILARYGIIRPYLMYVGNAYPHKNLENLSLAFAQVSQKRPDLQMVFVGKEDYFYERLKYFVKKKRIKNVVFAGYVPDYDLDIIFHNAWLYTWPSLYEGFGLPPLEAMAKGVPVVSSDHPCMKEILEDSVYYFDGKKPDSISAAIEKILSNQELADDFRERGYKQIKKYSWKKMTLKTLGTYNQLIKNKN